MYLILTGLEIGICEKENFELLGDWAKSHRPYYFWDAKKNIKTHKMPWENKETLMTDYIYLKKLHDNLIKDLSEFLNNENQVFHSNRYWQTLLDPWLVSYVAVLFDRWLTLEKSIANKKKYKVIIPKEPFPHKIARNCFYSYVNIFQEDEWNHNLFYEIINYRFNNNVKTIIDERLKPRKTKRELKSKLVYFKDICKLIINFFSLIFCRINLAPKVFLASSYLNKRDRFLLNIKLKQNPFFNLHFLNDSNQYILNYKNRNKRVIKTRRVKNSFEEFLYSRIYKDLPLELLEDYKNIKKSLHKSYIPELILSDNQHIHNTKFKHWLAYCIEMNTKVISSQHGGSINQGNLMEFQEEISDRYITWKRAENKKQKQLTPLNYTSIKKSYTNNGKFISLVGVDFPRYLFRCQLSGSSSEIFKHHYQILGFYRNLDKDNKEIFKFKPYVDEGWGLLKQYQEEFGELAIENNISYGSFLKRAKLIICTYPQTTFSDCIVRNKPVILLFPSDVWVIKKEMKFLENELKKAKILFNNFKDAANHINLIANDINGWWDSYEVKAAVKIFHDYALKENKSWEKEWVQTIKEVLKS